MAQSPDGQISLTDPDARSMATSGRGLKLAACCSMRSIPGSDAHLTVHCVRLRADRKMRTGKRRCAVSYHRPLQLIVYRRFATARGAVRPQAPRLPQAYV
jgi:hypothetical protein